MLSPWLALPLYAQQPEAPLPSAETAPAETGQTSLGEGFLWVDAGPRTVIDLVDAAIHPDAPAIWSTIARDGSVWVTTQSGSRWFEVLGPTGGRGSADEEALTEIEARLGELSSTVEIPDETALEDGEMDEEELEEEIEQATEEARAEAQQVIDEVQSELEAQPWFLAEADQDQKGLRPRTLFTRSSLLVVLRADGLHLSEDLGSSWHHVLEDPVSAFVELPGGGFVVGMPTGARWSATLLDWRPLPAFDGLFVHDLTETSSGVLASTDQGLWWSADGLGWRVLPAWFDETFTAIELAPGTVDGPGPLLLSARDGLWRAEQPAEKAATPTDNEIPLVLSLARLGEGLLLAASKLGPFESVDGGQRFDSLAEGLDEPALNDLEASGTSPYDMVVLISTDDGLKRRARAVARVEGGELPPWVGLSALVDASTHRRELATRPGRRWVRAMLPELSLEYIRNQVVGDDWNADTWTIRSVDTWWSGRLKLTWRPDAGTSSDTFDTEIADDLQLLVFDDEIVLDDGSLTALIGSKVDRSSEAYRSELTETISRLYTTRQRLVLEQQWLSEATLYEQTLRTLQTAEIEARLDALTDGAVSRWDGSTGESP